MLNDTRTPAEPMQAFDGSFARPSSGRRWAGVLATALVATTLVACGSNVKLDDVPVVDRSGTDASTLAQATTPFTGAIGSPIAKYARILYPMAPALPRSPPMMWPAKTKPPPTKVPT